MSSKYSEANEPPGACRIDYYTDPRSNQPITKVGLLGGGLGIRFLLALPQISHRHGSARCCMWHIPKQIWGDARSIHINYSRGDPIQLVNLVADRQW